MNIIVIDSLLPIKGGKGSALSRFSEENWRHRAAFCREFSSLGHNLLLIRAEISPEKENSAFSFREAGGFSELAVPLPRKKLSPLPIGESLLFGKILSQNAQSLGGLFKPDLVVSAGVLPFGFSAGAKIANCAGAPLIGEFSADPKELLLRTGAKHPFSPVLKIIQKNFVLAQKESSVCIGLFPGAQKSLKCCSRLYPLPYPRDFAKSLTPEPALKLRNAISSFKEGGGFCLCCPLPLEAGYPIGELICAAGEMGEKFFAVFIGSGAQKAAYQKYAVEKGIKNCFFLEKPDEEDLPFVLSGASALFLAENSLLKGCAAEQSLFLSAMESGLPVLAAAENHSDFFKKSGGAVIVKPKNKESLRLGLRAVLKLSTDDLEKLGACSKEFSGNYTYKKYIEDILKIAKETEK